MSDHPDSPDFSGSGPVEYRPADAGGPDAGIVARHETRLMSIPGVTSVGLGRSPDGTPALTVGVTDGGVARDLPERIEGLAVVVVVTGPVDAQKDR